MRWRRERLLLLWMALSFLARQFLLVPLGQFRSFALDARFFLPFEPLLLFLPPLGPRNVLVLLRGEVMLKRMRHDGTTHVHIAVTSGTGDHVGSQVAAL
jgi:hypothetical protein